MKLIGFAVSVRLVVFGLAVSGAAQSAPLKGTLMDIACSSHHATEAGTPSRTTRSACCRTGA